MYYIHYFYFQKFIRSIFGHSINSEKEEYEGIKQRALFIQEKYKKISPEGYEPHYFDSMSDFEIVDFDYFLNYKQSDDDVLDYFDNKYKNISKNSNNKRE